MAAHDRRNRAPKGRARQRKAAGARSRRGRTGSDAPRTQTSRALGLIGLDLSSSTSRIRTRSILPLMIGVLVVAMGFAALRIELLRIRYALADAMEQEQLLLDEQRSLTARMRDLRDPVELAARAEELGFVRPEQLIDLPSPGSAPSRATETVLARTAAHPSAAAADRP